MNRPDLARYALQPARIAVEGADETGVIVRVDDRVVAILVRLDAEHYEDDQGRWYLEAGFGPCAGQPPPFRRLSSGLVWISERLGHTADIIGSLPAEADLTYGAPAGSA